MLQRCARTFLALALATGCGAHTRTADPRQVPPHSAAPSPTSQPSASPGPKQSSSQTTAATTSLVEAPAASVPSKVSKAPDIPVQSGIAPKEYDRWIAQGRRLHQRKDYLGAAEAFQKAHSARPTDADALAELGWSAYFANDFVLAESATRAALETAGIYDKSLRGAALYNLGRILEATHRKAEATQAYSDSFALRPSTAARARLTALDSMAAEAALALRGERLTGPSASLMSLCKGDQQDTHCEIPNNGDDAAQTGGPQSLTARPPYRDVKIASAMVGPYVNHMLAIRTAAGWYVYGMFSTNRAVTGMSTSRAEIESLGYRDVVAGPPSEIVVTYVLWSASGGSSPDRGESSTEERAMFICGLDMHQVPACTSPITLEYSAQTGDEVHDAYTLGASFVPPDSMELTLDEGKASDSVRALLGKHRIVLGNNPGTE